MKRFLFILLLGFGFTSTANAQYDETIIFIEVGKSIEGEGYVDVYDIDDNGYLYVRRLEKSKIYKLYSNNNLYTEYKKVKHPIKLDKSVSSSSKYVWSRSKYGDYDVMTPNGPVKPRIGTEFFAISHDNTELIRCWCPLNSNEVREKKYYKAVAPSELNKEITYDFDFL